MRLKTSYLRKNSVNLQILSPYGDNGLRIMYFMLKIKIFYGGEMVHLSYTTSEETRKKLEIVKQKIAGENAIMGDDYIVTWDIAFSKMANRYLADSEIVEKAKSMKESETENKIKFAELREQIEKHFKEQNNNIEELIGAVVKQSGNTEVLQNIQSIARQNENISLDIKSIQEFNNSVNDDYKELIASIKNLLVKINEMSSALSGKITQKIKQQFGVSASIILHYIVRNNSRYVAKKSEEETIADIKKIVGNYRNIHYSLDSYSDDEVSKIIDKYAIS